MIYVLGRKLALLLAFCSSSVIGAELAPALKVANPRCEYRVNPLGLDAAHPRLSWELASDRRGVKQLSYHILVASSSELLAENKGVLWDSGLFQSGQSIRCAAYSYQ